MKIMLRSLNNILHRLLLLVALALTPGQLTAQVVAEPTEAKSPPQLVAAVPASGTFYLLGRIPSPPFPFDPYYGALPVFAYDGVFFVDDSAVSLFGMSFASGGEGGGMMAMSAPGPCNPCATNEFSGTNGASYLGGWTTNAGLKFAPTPVVLGNVFSTRLQEADTNSAYEIYEKFQLHTNFPWLRIAAGEVGQTNFSWSRVSTNMAFYLAADAVDSDWDGLSDAFEQLVSHTLPLDDDSDNDGILDGDEDWNGNGIPDRADYARLKRAVIFTSLPLAYEGGGVAAFRRTHERHDDLFASGRGGGVWLGLRVVHVGRAGGDE